MYSEAIYTFNLVNGLYNKYDKIIFVGLVLLPAAAADYSRWFGEDVYGGKFDISVVTPLIDVI